EAATLRCGAPGYLTIAYGPFAEDMADLEARLTPAVSLPGRVVDGDGEAISGAAVRSARPHGLGWNRHFGRLQGTGRWLLEAVKERSGDDGRFTVGGLVPSRGFELRVSRAGYAVHYQPVPPMEPGQVVDELVITLTRGRSGFGRVVNEHEMPIVGSEVQLLPTLTGPAAAQSFEVKENFGATTDSEGVFILHDLPLGTYYLAAKGRGFPELLVPGVEIEDGEGPLDLGTIVLVPGIVLAGEVVDETGAAVAGAELSLRNADGEQIVVQRATSPWFATTTSRHNGSYHLEGLPQKSRLALLVTAEGFLPQIVPLTIEDDDQRLDIELQTGARVTGRVFDRRGRGVSATVDFRPLPGRNRSVAGSRSVNTDSEGHFEAAGIQPDTYTIIAVAGSLQSEPIQRELTSEGLTDLDLQLRQWGSLEVTVVDSSGAAASQVWLSLASKAKPGENSVRRRSAFGVTGSDGIAVLQPLGAGAYELTARRSAFEPVRTRVEIEGDRPHSLRLRLEDRDQETHPVAGRVVDSAGLPVNGVEVRLVALGSGWARDRSLGRTGPAGTFEFRATAGEHRLICRHESYATHTSEPFLIPEGGRSDLLVELVEGAIVAGRISGLELEDLARLKVVARGPLRQREPLEVFGEQYGVVNFDGEFRVSGLQAGEWIIRAELLNPTRSAQERIEVPQGTDELRVDLRFADGYRMTGSVLQPGGPLAGATVTARCAGEFRGETFTDSDGRFVIDHIPHGRCTIVATDGRTGDSTRQTIEFDVDIELVLELGGL
ncbi:MAG: carboxypeptidase-like regulatory domain-containing protein, partial [Acidobacteriota bacterium]